jgi:hypothetical protein
MSDARANRIVLHGTIREFFREVLTAAVRNQRVATHAMAVAYLTEVLAEFARAERFHDQKEGFGDEPLAAQLCRAMQAAPDTRVALLRRLGDLCLFVSGFFSDSFNRKLVDVDYYMQMGGGAYATIGATLRVKRGGEDFATLYEELAGKFDKYVDVFAEVSEQSQLSTNKGTLRLYEKWLRTSSERVGRELRERGVLPTDAVRTKFVQ